MHGSHAYIRLSKTRKRDLHFQPYTHAWQPCIHRAKKTRKRDLRFFAHTNAWQPCIHTYRRNPTPLIPQQHKGYIFNHIPMHGSHAYIGLKKHESAIYVFLLIQMHGSHAYIPTAATQPLSTRPHKEQLGGQVRIVGWVSPTSIPSMLPTSCPLTSSGL